jgi:hypothetical protein
LCFSRGKKVFRKFSDEADAESDGDDLGLLAARPDLIDSSVTTRIRPLTRSSVKPRVLFPSAKPRLAEDTHSGITDTEATTDVDEHTSLSKPDVEVSGTPGADAKQGLPVTPTIQSTAATPSSPGATPRSLRSRGGKNEVFDNATPSAVPSKIPKRISPFDGWMRQKSASGKSRGSKKRESDTMASLSGPALKKPKANKA